MIHTISGDTSPWLIVTTALVGDAVPFHKQPMMSALQAHLNLLFSGMDYFLSFADKTLSKSLRRIGRQALSLNVFASNFLLDESDLDPQFVRHFHEYLNPGIRGYGYWCWKAQVCLQALSKVDEGDRIVYADVGCHLVPNGLWRLYEYFDLVDKSPLGILGFEVKQPKPDYSPLSYDGRRLMDQFAYQWIKGDLFDYFGFRYLKTFVNSNVVGATVVVIKKCSASIEFIEEWCSIPMSDFTLIDDTLSKSPNLPGFIGHRHDQSIFTLLCLKHKVPTISAYEYWYPRGDCLELSPDWNAIASFPIHAKRDKQRSMAFQVRTKLNRFLRRISVPAW